MLDGFVARGDGLAVGGLEIQKKESDVLLFVFDGFLLVKGFWLLMENVKTQAIAS